MTSAPAVLDAAPSSAAARPGRGIGLALLAVAITTAGTALALDLQNSDADRDRVGMGYGVITGTIGVMVVAAALPVLARHRRHPVGWTMALAGLVWASDGVGEAWMARGVAASPDLPLTGFATWYVVQFGAVLISALPVVLVLYPSGRLLCGRWATLSRVTVAAAFALPTMLVLAPAEVLSTDDYEMPVATGMPSLPVPPEVYRVLLGTAQTATLLSLVLAVVIVFARQRSADPGERVQLRWLLWAAITCVLMAGASLLAPTGTIAEIAIVLCLAVTCASVVIGIRNPYVRDVDALIAGTLVYGLVAGVVIALDVALVALVDLLVAERISERRVTLFVLVVVLAAYGPLRTWLGTLARRLLVGRRGDRYTVVTGLAARLEEAAGVETQLPALATAVASSFRLGFVRVEVFGHAGEVLTATHGVEPTETREVPITYGGDAVGRLVLPVTGVRSMLSRRDSELLLDVVRQAAMAVRSSRLAEDLQVIRERLVTDREEDRRRIRRDLHDGLGPVLGGVAMRLDAAGNSLTSDPEGARRLIATSRQDISDALVDVRRLVHGLRPPALDDLGLLTALEQQAERVRSAELAVTLSTAGLGALPAAVEVAVYRIASEALTNAVRHASATAIRISLTGEDGWLAVEIGDDGRGIDTTMPAGVGLHSIRERAAELGGQVEVRCPGSGGTVVSARLPLPATKADR